MATDDGPGIRVTRKRTFTVIYNDQFMPGMSLKAWGLYCHLSGKPDGWDARVYALQKEFKDGRDAIYAALKELVELELITKEEWWEGNLKRTRFVLEAEGPSSSDRQQTSRSAPDTGFPDAGAPDPDSPDPENPPQVKKDVVSTDQASMDLGFAADAASGATATKQRRGRKPRAVPEDLAPFMPTARAIVTRYMDWWKIEKGAPILKASDMFFSLMESFVAPALRDGFSERAVVDCLAACARSGNEWPSDSVWRRHLNGAAGTPPAQTRPPEAPRAGSGVWDRVAQPSDQGRESA